MKTVAYCILHYGVEWLYWSLRSIVRDVDEIHVFYTPTPSHGHATTEICPERKEELYEQFRKVLKIRDTAYWHDTPPNAFPHEGYQREYAADYCRKMGADLIAVLDADELWPVGMLKLCIEYAMQTDARNFRVPMMHFWRSMHWVCTDPAFPTRLIKLDTRDGDSYVGQFGKVYHMGYAQTPAIIRYKQFIHGHKAEWRHGWFENKFLAWNPSNPIEDVHPTCESGFWTPIRYEDDGLSLVAKDHPYWDMDYIK